MIHTDLKEKLKDAMRAKDTVRLSVIRDLLTSFTNELVSQGKKPDEALDDASAQTVIKRKIKQRKESIESFESAGRDELADTEKAELAILEEFRPPEASDEDIRAIIEKKQAELGIDDPAKSGVLTGAVMKELQGNADGARVKALVEEILS